MADHEQGGKKKKDSQNKKHKQGGMGMRGVSRPMAQKEVKQHHQKMQDAQQDKKEQKKRENEQQHGEHQGDGNGHHQMDRDMMLTMHYAKRFGSTGPSSF